MCEQTTLNDEKEEDGNIWVHFRILSFVVLEPLTKKRKPEHNRFTKDPLIPVQKVPSMTIEDKNSFEPEAPYFICGLFDVFVSSCCIEGA